MAKAAFWKSDRLLNIALTLLTLAAAASGRLRVLELAAYDAALWLTGRPPALSSGEQLDFMAPAWGGWVAMAAIVLVGVFLATVLPGLNAGAGALASLTLMLLMTGTQFGLLLGAGLWIPLAAAACLLTLGYLLWGGRRFLGGAPDKAGSSLDTAEARRMLGLACQGQGELDRALEFFNQCPMNDGLMENLYNLGLDFERQRQFAKAEALFRRMAEHDPEFRDISRRLSRGRPSPAGGSEMPQLGRYRLERELGKGAMGIVYLGHDQQYGRVVALKTMALAGEFDADELADVKQRFFREAETVGRLSHPNIVTMYDAGEANDLAYIAMEFIAGQDLMRHCKPSALLPLPTVLSIVARVADALAYAHSQQVVHRDVKPANIMYEAATDQVKVTDFGVARLTDSSRTKTGMVLGTPSYMSPEQLAGRKVDGRSDIYALGVTLFQLCCGQLPFAGESLAQLMYKIANEPTPDILAINPALPPPVVAVIGKAMAKNVAQRYQSAASFAADVRRCLTGPVADPATSGGGA